MANELWNKAKLKKGIPGVMADGIVIEATPDYGECVEPLGDWVLIRNEKKTMTEGGIALPDSAQFPEFTARVLKVGPGIWHHGELRRADVEPGDQVMVDPQAPAFGMPRDSKVLLVRADAIVAKFRAPEKERAA